MASLPGTMVHDRVGQHRTPEPGQHHTNGCTIVLSRIAECSFILTCLTSPPVAGLSPQHLKVSGEGAEGDAAAGRGFEEDASCVRWQHER